MVAIDLRPTVAVGAQVTVSPQGVARAALLELSHELYYAEQCFGPVHKLGGFTTKTSGVTHDADDLAVLFAEHRPSGMTTTIHLDICSDPPCRCWELCDATGHRHMHDLDTSEETMTAVWSDQLSHFIENLHNPYAAGSILKCAPLFKQILKVRDEGFLT